MSLPREHKPEGVKREKEIERAKSSTHKPGHKLIRVIIGLLVLTVLLTSAGWIWLGNDQHPGFESQSTEGMVAESIPTANLGVQARIPPEKSIAILPFVNRGAGMDDSRLFSDGIHEDLLASLSKIHELKVISRTSVMTYRGTTKNRRQIASELGVAYLLEGSVEQAESRLHIRVRLINARANQQLWAESYNRELTTGDLFEIQGEITRAIAAALEAPLNPEEDRNLGTAPTTSLEAYRAVLMARQIDQNGGFKAIARSTKFAQRAIDLDAEYADAHLELARILASAIKSGAKSDADAGDRIQASIITAMSLRPDYAPAYLVLGDYQSISGKPGSDKSFEKAMRLDSGNAKTLYGYGKALRRSGKPEAALTLLQQASDLDPLSPIVLLALGRIHDDMENFEDARNTFSRIREIDPGSPRAYELTGATLFAQGKITKALHWIRQAQAIDPRDFQLGGWMVFLNDCLEDYESALEWSGWLDRWVTNQPMPMAMQARHHYLTGNFELALQYANLALRLRLPNRWGSDAIFMRIKRDEALAKGDPESGIEVFARQYPDLLDTPPTITPDNLLQAIDLAQLLELAGRLDQSRLLLNAAIVAYDQPYFTTGSTRSWLVPARAEALAIMDEHEAAIVELRRIVDAGWRVYWRWETELNFNFSGIRKSSEFQKIIRELAADMAEQRIRAQAMAKSGEIAPPPDVDLNRLKAEFLESD